MTFADTFRLDEKALGSVPEVLSGFGVSPGTYCDGAITVLDRFLSGAVLESWQWLLGQDAVALVATSTGDLFFWSERHHAVYFLEVQRGRSTFVDKDLNFFLDNFLTQDGIQKPVLHRDMHEIIKEQNGVLAYGECYVAEPWVRSGGSGDASTYAKGNLAVYLSLVGQSIEHSMRLERSK